MRMFALDAWNVVARHGFVPQKDLQDTAERTEKPSAAARADSITMAQAQNLILSLYTRTK